MKPPHKRFFSSLKQVEKRLKLDNPNPPPETETQPSESSTASPLYLHNTTTASTLHTSIDQPPQEFLSILSQPNPNPNQSTNLSSETNDPNQHSTIGDIDSMIQLLSLSEFDGKGFEMPDVADDEFYDKVVRVKGPKCKKEVERLDGWIKCLMENGREPLRLAHLLLAKAAIVSVGRGGGEDGVGVEFSVTVDEFLRIDPPSDWGNAGLN